jgi:hypothetical protein
MNITLNDYWMGRDDKYGGSLTPEIRQNATTLVAKLNELLDLAAIDGVEPVGVASGWLPAAVNDATSNAAKRSTHITGEGCDLRDDKDRSFARWCLRNLEALARLDLYMEDPRWTPTWVHLQNRAPGSGRRVYVPSAAAPLAKPLPEQGG